MGGGGERGTGEEEGLLSSSSKKSATALLSSMKVPALLLTEAGLGMSIWQLVMTGECCCGECC